MYWRVLSLVVTIVVLSIGHCEADCDFYNFACDDGTCIKAELRCDGTAQCSNEEDEASCDSDSIHLCDWGKELQCRVDGEDVCKNNAILCELPTFPDFAECADTRLDLVGCPCLVNQVRCEDTSCVPKAARCEADGCGVTAPGCDYNATLGNCPSGFFVCMDMDNKKEKCHPNSMMCDNQQDCYTSEEDGCAGPGISFSEPRKFYAGETYTLVAKITGKPQPQVTLLRYDMRVSASDRIIIDYPTDSDPTITERDYTVTFKELHDDNIGYYKIFAENKGYIAGQNVPGSKYNTELSDTLFIVLQGRTQVSNMNDTDPEHEGRPQDISLLQDKSYTMYCNVYGSPKPNVTFFKDNVDITKDEEHYTVTKKVNPAGDNQTIWMLTIAELVREEDKGTYMCHAENDVGEDSITVNLDINIKPGILDISAEMNVKTGSDVTLTCQVEGYPIPSISWLDKDGDTVSSDMTLLLTDIGIADTPFVYTCKAENEHGTAQDHVTIHVYNDPEIAVQDFLVEHEEAWSHTFSVIAVDLNRTFTIVKDGEELDSQIWAYSSTDDYTTMEITLQTVNETSYAHIGNYSITVINDIGSTTEVFEFEVEIMPEFTVSLPENVTVAEGSELVLSVTVLAYPHPIYTWFINGTETEAYTGPTLSKRAELTDNGTYTVEAMNSYGAVNTSTFLTVTPFGCANEPCQNNATCNDLGNSDYNCTCHENFSGKDCDINNWCDVSVNQCQHNSNCSTLDYPENYQCACEYAHRGRDCEETIDYCAEGGNDRCGVDEGRGLCVVTGLEQDEGFQCYCKYTYGGKHCTDIQHCTPNKCQNGGSCVVYDGEESCECPEAFEGDHCETKKSWWCDGKCNGRARCYDKTDKRCLCEYPWIGDACETLLSHPLHFKLSTEGYLLSNLDTFKADQITQSVELPLQLGDLAAGIDGKVLLLTQYPGHITNLTGDQVHITMNQSRILSASIICGNSLTTITLPKPVPAHTPLIFRFRMQFNKAKLSVTNYHTKDAEHAQTSAADLSSTCAQLREQRISNYHKDNVEMYVWDDVVVGDTVVRYGEDGLWTRGREVFNADPCDVNLCNNGGTCTAVGGSEVCECDTGYTGQHCNDMIDQCAGMECMNGGHCEHGACVCQLGFSGVLCESDMEHADYVLGPRSKLMYKLQDVEEFSMTFTTSGDIDAVHLLTIGSDTNLLKFGVRGEASYITVVRGVKKGVYSGPFVPANETVTLNMTISSDKIVVSVGEENVILEHNLPASTGSLRGILSLGNIKEGTVTVDSVGGTVMSGSNVGSSDLDPCEGQCNTGFCNLRGENSIECSDCPADTNPVTCGSSGCVPGCDGRCTDLGYCSCDMGHQGDRCEQVLDLSNGFPASISQSYSTLHYKGSPVQGYNINIMFSVKLHSDKKGLIAKVPGHGRLQISWHLVEGLAVKFTLMSGADTMSVTLSLSGVDQWLVMGFTQKCDQGGAKCGVELTAGDQRDSSSRVGCMLSLTGDMMFGAQGEKGVIASFAYPVIGMRGQEESLSAPVGGQNLVRDTDHICDVLPSPCQNGGTCNKESALYSCTCEGSWTGDHCERQKTACDDVSCVAGSTCREGQCLCNYPFLQSSQCNIRSSGTVGLCVKNGHFVMRGLAPAMTANTFILSFNVKLSEQSDGERALFTLTGGAVSLSTVTSTVDDERRVSIRVNDAQSTPAVYGWNTLVLEVKYASVLLRVNNAEVSTVLDSTPLVYDGTVTFGQFSGLKSDGGCLSDITMSDGMHSTVLDEVIEGYGVTSCTEQVIAESDNGQYGSAELWDIVGVM